MDAHPIRAFRDANGISLDELADKIGQLSGKRPSTAKLSRIETNKQLVSLDIVPALKKITGIPGKTLRPDLAELFAEAAE